MNRNILLTLALLGASCSRDKDVADVPAPSSEAGAEALTSSAAARWIPIRAPQDSSMLTAPCVVRAQADAMGEVSSTFRAQVSRVHVQVGDVVQKGQPIVDVSAPEIVAAAASYVGLGNRLRVHRKRLNSLQTLREEGMVRTSAVFEQEALVAELEAQMREAVAVLRLAGLAPKDAGRMTQDTILSLRAPVDGVVASLSGHPGEVLDGSTPLARIIGPALARIEVSSPAALMIGETLTMTSADGARYKLAPTPVSSVVAADTGMHRTWFALADSTTRLGDGLRCTLEWSVADGVWEAPAGAVATTPEGSAVWRRRDDKVERVIVEVMRSSGTSILLRGPLQDGDMLSADGATGSTTKP